MDDASIADENIHSGNLCKSVFDGSTVCHIAADGGGAAGICYGFCGLKLFFIEKVDPVALGGEQFDRCSADSPAAAGDHNS